MGNLTPIAKGLLVLNIAILLIDQFVNKGVLTAYGALYYFDSPNFRPWQLLTHMFLHADPMHLLGNMLGLFFFGPWLERSWGARNFFIFYFACGFGGAALELGGLYTKNQIALNNIEQYAKNPSLESLAAYQKKHHPRLYSQNKQIFESNKAQYAKADASVKRVIDAQVRNTFAKMKENFTPSDFRMVGASGAIFGILIAFALFFPNVEMMLLFPPIPLKAKYFVLIYMGITIYAASGGNIGMSNVAHLAHLGGAIVGFILTRFWLWRFRPR